MKKYISPTRREYLIAYREIRLFGEELFHDYRNFPETTEQECALESRDWHDSQFTGWTSRIRRARFLYRKIHRLPQPEFTL